MAGEINWGLLDTSLPQKAFSSYADGQREQAQNALAAAQLQSAQRQNKLADLAMSDDMAKRDAYRSGGGDLNKTIADLQQRGLGDAAMKLIAQQQDLASKKAATSKTVNDVAHQKLGMFRDALANVDTPEAAQSWMTAQYNDQDTGPVIKSIAPDPAAALQKIPTDPAAFAQWKQQQALGMTKWTEANKPTIRTMNNGATNDIVAVPGLGGTPTRLSSTPVTLSPAQREQYAIQRGNLNERHAENNPAPGTGAPDSGMLDDQTKKMMAEQYLRGDTSVFTNLGRGAQGAKNIIALRQEIAKQSTAAGLTGADQAAVNAEYFGTKAGQRTVGTRTANVELATNEASQLIPLAREASANVSRSGLLPFGKAQIMFDNQTNDPNLRQFAAANNSLINVYARAISPSGVPTVADKEHAREMLTTAYDDKSYNAVLNQMQKEMDAARTAPAAVRKTFRDAVTNRSDTTSQAGAIPSGWSVKEH